MNDKFFAVILRVVNGETEKCIRRLVIAPTITHAKLQAISSEAHDELDWQSNGESAFDGDYFYEVFMCKEISKMEWDVIKRAFDFF